MQGLSSSHPMYPAQPGWSYPAPPAGTSQTNPSSLAFNSQLSRPAQNERESIMKLLASRSAFAQAVTPELVKQNIVSPRYVEPDIYTPAGGQQPQGNQYWQANPGQSSMNGSPFQVLNPENRPYIGSSQLYRHQVPCNPFTFGLMVDSLFTSTRRQFLSTYDLPSLFMLMRDQLMVPLVTDVQLGQTLRQMGIAPGQQIDLQAWRAIVAALFEPVPN